MTAVLPDPPAPTTATARAPLTGATVSRRARARATRGRRAVWPSSVKGRPWIIASSRTAAEKASLSPARRRVAATRSASAWSGATARAVPIAGA